MLLRIHIVVIPIILLSSQVLQIAAVPTDGQQNSLLPAFTLVGQGGQDQGNCAGNDLERLKTSYEDACVMSRRALEDLNFLMDQAKATSGKGPDKAKKEDYENYHRILPTFIALFGSNPFDKQGNEVQNGPLGRMGDFFQTMVNRKCSGQMELSRLYCTDKHWKFLKTDDPDPTDPSKKVSDNHPQCSAKGGVWYSPVQPAGSRWKFDPPPITPGAGPNCEADDLAVTSYLSGTIDFCPASLNPDKTYDTIKGLEGSIKPTEKRYSVKDKLHFRDQLKNKDVTMIEDLRGDNKENLPLTFLHEMVHLVQGSIDEEAVDGDGKPIKGVGNVWNDEKNQWEKGVVNRATYGWELCRNLVKHKPENSWENPDSLAFFALAMYFRQWDWSRGYAQPTKKAD